MTHAVDTAMLAQLRELLGERFTELVERFVGDGERRLGLLRTAVVSRNFDVMHAEAHGLKGSSRNIGANGLGDLCDVMEQQGKARIASDPVTLLAAIEQEFAAVVAQLRVS